MSNFTKKIQNLLPLKGSKIYIDNINIDDLVLIKNFMKKEPLEKMTCNPIKYLNKDEEKNEIVKMKKSLYSYFFGIYENNNKILIGRIRCFNFNPRNNSIEIGYFILSNYRSYGYAFESITLLLKILFYNININKVIAQTGEFNRASISLLKKLNFVKDGVLRKHHELNNILYDDYIFSLLKDEYRLNIRHNQKIN